ncbi:MAG: phosphoglycerate dehydrogenase, partial [Pseudomonadota bacterium]
MNQFKVLISDKLSPEAEKVFADKNVSYDTIVGMSPDELVKSIGQYDGLVIRSATKVTKEVIAAASKLKVIGRAGIGVDNIDIEAATNSGIVVMNTPFGNSITTAEHAISMLFSLARSIPQANSSTHAGQWEKSKFVGTEVTGKILGLIGCGNIGSIVADRAQGLKMKVIAYDPYLSKEKAIDLNVEKVELDELLERSDFISLHTPLTNSTKYILNEAALSKTKKSVKIINCARGGLIDEAALKNAIIAGDVAGAALDVYEEEPAKDNILFGMEQVICTPHLGASTNEAQENVAIQVAHQISDFLNKGSVSNALNIPSVSDEEAMKLSPYIELAKQLGSFIGQLTENGITSIKIEFEGNAARINTKPIIAVTLTNILKPLIENINIVNAPLIAKERNIDVSEVIHERFGDYQTMLKVTIQTDKQTRTIAGTLLGETMPRIVEVHDVKLEASLMGNMIFINNIDEPGLIGNIGKLLAENKINIANFHLGRNYKTANNDNNA